MSPRTARPLTEEEVDRYRRIVAGRRHREMRDWSDRDIAALIATIEECEGRVVQAQEEGSRLRCIQSDNLG